MKTPTIKIDNHGYDGLTPGFWIFAIGSIILLASSFAYAGIEGKFREEISYRSDTMLDVAAAGSDWRDQLWQHCLDGNVVEVSRPGCEPLAQYIISEADKAERELGHE